MLYFYKATTIMIALYKGTKKRFYLLTAMLAAEDRKKIQ